MTSCFVRYEDIPGCPMERVNNVTKQITIGYSLLLRKCNHTASKVLTDPKTPTGNYGLDNENNDLIIKIDDILGTATSLEGVEYSMDEKSLTRYKVVQMLGQGTFGQVIKCVDMNTDKCVAVKVLKNKPAYFKQSLIELTVLHFLNNFYDNSSHSRVLKMVDYFMYYNHICIVTEMLGIDLYELMRRNRNHSFSIQTIRKFIQQILRALLVLAKGNIVHCDIKPENVLLVGQTSKVKLIDFGSACFENYTLYSYIQSRHYRAPEIVLGLPYSCAIDMWSVGCMTAELFLGYPLFGATSEYNLLYKMIEMLGMPPNEMLERGSKTHKYFYNEEGTFLFKEQFEYEYENNLKVPENRNYFKYTTLKELIMLNQMRVSNTETMSSEKVRECLYDFLCRCLAYDPKDRMTPDQALNHPFLTDRPLEEYIVPPRLFPFVEYGKTMSLDQKDFVQVMLQKMPELRYIRGSYNTQQYFKIFKIALNNGHVVNIMADSPMRGTITPPSLASVFRITINPEEEEQQRRMLSPLPRKVAVKLQPIPVRPDYKDSRSFVSNPRKIDKKEKERLQDRKLGVSLPSSLESSPSKEFVARAEKLQKKEEKLEKERLKQLEKERKKEEKEREKERKKEEKKSRSTSRPGSKGNSRSNSKARSKASSREPSQEREEKIEKASLGFFRRHKKTASDIDLIKSRLEEENHRSQEEKEVSVNEQEEKYVVEPEQPKRADSVDTTKKKKWGFSLFHKDKKTKGTASKDSSVNSQDETM
ncbi:mitogen-activated protein kinase mpkC, putative [Entamoeba invadens IP1]|uniref:mitogen-activated protein kinase mpkC, putative n=1 Tax=Entamoeba invadens IP1 TaxID=370355 RepID=UPI0002C3EAEB|nr:mitogen-activated protein kinase mpkC, putative [Entamoeba invadens IP1]ELP85017.1 mitogen-activated protein kinase mpkC, putative [Entamoeba invadens IP1]|eukprot:XP_004184363.1 mitogen-activated protein kinase mpkC, putative [Entamoeba invadens IP1]